MAYGDVGKGLSRGRQRHSCTLSLYLTYRFFGFRVSGFKVRAPGLGLGVTGLGFRV